MKIIVILTLSISLFSYSFIRIDAVNAGENEVGTVDYEALAHRSKELDPHKNPEEVIALLEPHKNSKDNKSFIFYKNLGCAYKKKGRFKEAISAYVRSLELEPDQPRALYNLGIVYYRNNELSKALKYFLKCAEQRPGHSNTKEWIDHLEKKLARPAPKPMKGFFQDITWGGGQFVIVGKRLILTSADGIEWVVQHTRGHHLRCVAWGNGLYVAIRGKGKIFTSHDGIVWVKHHVPVMERAWLSDIAWVNNKFLAVGPEGIILTSVDGVKWTRQDSGITEDLVGIAGVNGQFMVVGKRGTVLRSPNASAWTAEPGVVVGVRRLNSVAWNGQTLVAVDLDGIVITRSSDQRQWEVDKFDRKLRDVISSGDRFVAVGSDIMISPDGVEWTFLNARDPETNNRLSLRRVAAGNDTYVAIGSAKGHSIFTSRDGITWRGGVGILIVPSVKLTLPNALAKTSPIDEEKEQAQARERFWNTLYMLVVSFYGLPVWAYIVLQIWAIYRTRGVVWRIFAILAVVPTAFILYMSAMGAVYGSNLWFLPLWFLMPIVIVYLLFLPILQADRKKHRHQTE